MNAKTSPDIICFDQENCHRLLFVLNEDNFSFFSSLLQHGFYVKVVTGASIKQMLCDQFGLNPDYVDNRIKTVFYNGSPVDKMETAIIEDGTTLALSAAMPGLVGATFRSSGLLSPFRASISFRPDDVKISAAKKGAVFMKLFNLLISEIGPAFLSNGILVEKTMLYSFLKEQKPIFWAQCRSVFLGDHSIDYEKLVHNGVPGEHNFVLLAVDIQK